MERVVKHGQIDMICKHFIALVSNRAHLWGASSRSPTHQKNRARLGEINRRQLHGKASPFSARWRTLCTFHFYLVASDRNEKQTQPPHHHACPRKKRAHSLPHMHIYQSQLYKNQLFFKHTSKSKYDYIIIFVSIELQNNILLEYVLGKMVKLLFKKNKS